MYCLVYASQNIRELYWDHLSYGRKVILSELLLISCTVVGEWITSAMAVALSLAHC